MTMRKFTLSTLKGGALEERFQEGLKEVAMNIADPNTEARLKRKITLEITFSPNEGRDHAAIAIAVKTKLQPYMEVNGELFFGYDGQTGELTAQEHDPDQRRLFTEPGEGDKADDAEAHN